MTGRGSARARVAAVSLLVAAALAGCGSGSHGSAPPSAHAGRTGATTPGAPTTRTGATTADEPPASALARARRTHELATPHRSPSVAGGWRTPTAAVESFAETYINWTAATIAPRLRALARASVGQARAAVAAQAAQVASDGELRRGGIANAGVVEAVGTVAGRSRRYAVVTRERTTASRAAAYRALAPAWHVALATVARLPDGLWVLSGWQPEN